MKLKATLIFLPILLVLGLVAGMLGDTGYGRVRNTVPATPSELNDAIELARRYAPILRMHPDEQFMPQGVEALLENAALRDENGAVILDPGSVTLENLGEYAGEGDEGLYLDLPPDIEAAPQPRYPVKVYAAVQEGRPPAARFIRRVYLQYYLFYLADHLNPSLLQDLCRDLYQTARVPSGTPLIGGKCEPHEADWELIQLEFDADGIADILDNDIEPVRVSYSQHYWSEDRPWRSTPAIDRHPVAYVSLDKHANYFGTDDGLLDPNASGPDGESGGRSVAVVRDLISDRGRELLPPVGNDHAEPCQRADPGNFQACTYTLQWIDAATPWVAFRGKWGDQKVEGPDHPIRWDLPYLWAASGHGVQTLVNPEHR